MSETEQYVHILRRGGQLGIIGVMLFFLGTLLGSGIFVGTPNVLIGYSDLPTDAELTEQLADISVQLKFSSFFSHVVVPLMYLVTFIALHDWMKASKWWSAGWVFYAHLLAVGLFLVQAALRVSYTTFIFSDTLIQLPDLDLVRLGALMVVAFNDMTYVTLCAAQTIVGSFLWRQGRRFDGLSMIFNSVWTIGVVLAGPFETLTPFNVYAYGAPIASIFIISAALLRHADHVAETVIKFGHTPTQPTA